MTISQTHELISTVSSGVILIVDDIAANRHVLGSLLRKAGYEVLSASSANHAISQVDLQVPDLILLDIMMPGIDGFALARKFVADPRTRKVPIIFISALSEGADKHKAFELGGADYVTKPFHTEEVLARVANQLRIARLQRELEREKLDLLRANQMLVKSQQQTAQVFSALSIQLVGTVLAGKYRIEEQIGRGGFGVVYRATHLLLERSVAVKVFRPTRSAGADALARFQLEGVSLCRVNHPNAVAVLDSGITPEGIAYLVMELLRGPTLYSLLRKERRLSEARCIEILLPLCEVLIAAHAADIVHRDIKPENVLLHQGPDGERVKVLDFGIAKLVGDELDQERPVTSAQELLGTPIYIAPERFTSTEYDGRSDVYSIGVMLYEMLCGELPFGESDRKSLQVMFNHLHKEPSSMRMYRSDLSLGMEALVMRSLAKDPTQRPTAQQLRDELLRLRDEAGQVSAAQDSEGSSASAQVQSVDSQAQTLDIPKSPAPQPLTKTKQSRDGQGADSPPAAPSSPQAEIPRPAEAGGGTSER